MRGLRAHNEWKCECTSTVCMYVVRSTVQPIFFGSCVWLSQSSQRELSPFDTLFPPWNKVSERRGGGGFYEEGNKQSTRSSPKGIPRALLIVYITLLSCNVLLHISSPEDATDFIILNSNIIRMWRPWLFNRQRGRGRRGGGFLQPPPSAAAKKGRRQGRDIGGGGGGGSPFFHFWKVQPLPDTIGRLWLKLCYTPHESPSDSCYAHYVSAGSY